MKTKGEFTTGRLFVAFRRFGLVQAGLLLLCLAIQSPAQGYKILHTFGTNVMGLNPRSTLIQAPDGALYGTTESGGVANRGQVFKVNPDGTGYTTLKDFTGSDGACPEGALVLSGTTLYGTTSGGGTTDNGTIFKVSTDGSGFSVLKHFTGYDGGNPFAKLIVSSSVLYGTTADGGAFWNGTVFKVNTDGTGYTVLKHFTGNIDGGWPYGGLVLSGATLYGTANGGGSYGAGTAFKINVDGSGFSVLRSFSGGFDGGGPSAGLVMSGANLYGTATWGGNVGNGTVFMLNINGSGFSVLKDFTDYAEGTTPVGDLLLSDDTLYGTALWGGSAGNGTVFKLNTDGSGFIVLKDFTNSTVGANCYAGLLLSGTTLYGTAAYGGMNAYGSVFKLGTDGSDFIVLTNFTGGDGVSPIGSMLLSGTNFYGATYYGGIAGVGTLFRVNADGSDYSVLKDFTNSVEGYNPQGGLAMSGATLYGTAGGGSSGNGVVFKVNLDGSGYTVIKDFTNQLDGAYPNGSLLISENILYGTTSGGGSNGFGAVFTLNTDGSGFTVLHSFSSVVWSSSAGTNADGAWPQSGLLLSGGMLYGTAVGGGTNGHGTIFRVSTDGSDYAVIKDFTGNEGSNPSGRLTLSDGTLYGTTEVGGPWYGTVFKVNTDGSGFEVLKTFSGNDGGGPQGGLTISGSALYGTTAWGGLGYGNLFQLGTDGSGFTVLKQFAAIDGNSPNGGLVLDGTTLYGTTGSGAASDSGVLFSLSLLAGAPEIQMQPQSQTAHLHWSVSFVVAAGGIPAPAYQWYFNDRVIDGATNALLELNDVQGAQAGGYWAVVTNSYGSVMSVVATLTVEDPFINNQPGSQYGQAGASVSFNVDAGGTDPLAFQWFKDGVRLIDAGNVSGSLTWTLTITNVSGPDSGWFWVVVTNGYGSVTSVPVMLEVQDPFINSQPSDQFVNAGDTAQLSVDAAGTPPLGYQWSKDGVSLSDGGRISGAQTPTFTLSNVVGADAGGYSVTVSNMSGTVFSSTAQLFVNQAVADFFNPGADNGVRSVALQADGKVLVGGAFTTLGGHARSHIARLYDDGRLDSAFNPGAGDDVTCIAVQADGKILVGGWFTALGGQAHDHLGRLNASGTPDTTFNASAHSDVSCLALQPDGKILVGGGFSILNGQVHKYLGRLNGDGTLDTNFTCGADNPVNCIAVQADGKILIGGFFNSLGGQPRNYLGRLNGDGTVDMTFNPGANDGVACLLVQPDGKILVGGWFTALGGRACNRIGRLNPDGMPDTTFWQRADATVLCLAQQADGKTVLGGSFSVVGAQTHNFIVRLNSDGSVDTSFYPQADGGVDSLAVQPDGKILVGGWFNTLANQPRAYLARLNNTEPANESLTFDGSTITWLRGGSAPEVWRTSFVVSTNGSDWFILGDGTRITGGWQLIGVSASPTATLGALGFVPGSGVSSWFVESLIGAPAIVTQPDSAAKPAGAYVAFRVLAGGTPPLAYQWFKDGVMLSDVANISGAQSPVLTLTNVLGADAGGYFVTISNVFGSVTSVGATLTVQDPFIATQPLGQTVLLGSNATFRAQAVGTAPLAYQWRHDGTNLVDTPRITGSQQPTLAIANVQSSDAGDYQLVVSNIFGQVTSSTATMTVVARLQLPLVFDIQAFIDGRDQLVFRGNTLQWSHYENAAVGRWEGHNEPTIISTAMGGQPVLTNVSWIPTWPEPPPAEIRYPANSSLFTGLAPAMPASENLNVVLTAISVRGAATVVQTPSTTNAFALVIDFDDNPLGGADWYHISLAVTLPEPPSVVTPPASSTAEVGSLARFEVKAAGSAPLAYQWIFNSAPLSGATTFALLLPSVQFSDLGVYTVVVTNAAGAVTSAPAMLQVIAPVERRPVPAIDLIGDAGSLLNLDYASSLVPAPNWLLLDTISLVSTSQLYFDVTAPMAPQRYYRAWQTGTPIAPSLSLVSLVPAITLTGNIGDHLRLDYINQVGPIDAWVTLDTVTLSNTSQLYFDVTSIGQPPRLYRLVPVP
jgi:uncharacterized delta-60 repeat protein